MLASPLLHGRTPKVKHEPGSIRVPQPKHCSARLILCCCLRAGGGECAFFPSWHLSLVQILCHWFVRLWWVGTRLLAAAQMLALASEEGTMEDESLPVSSAHVLFSYFTLSVRSFSSLSECSESEICLNEEQKM